jgi:hypothetical protein
MAKRMPGEAGPIFITISGDYTGNKDGMMIAIMQSISGFDDHISCK